MKIYIALFLFTAFIFTACSSSQPTTNTANTGNSAQAQNQSPPATLSPTETMLALNKAARERNSAAVKNLISKGTLEMMEANAREQNTTVDELLKNDENTPFEEIPEMRNEKIEGDRATVEVKNKLSDDWIALPFVKENGVWKVAVDRYIEDMRQKMLEEMKQPPAGSSEKKKK